MLDRVAVFSAAPSTAFLALLLELLLSSRVGKTEIELDTIMLNESAMEVLDDPLGNLASFESEMSQYLLPMWGRQMGLPSKANFFADPRWHISADLGRDSAVRQEVFREVLEIDENDEERDIFENPQLHSS